VESPKNRNIPLKPDEYQVTLEGKKVLVTFLDDTRVCMGDKIYCFDLVQTAQHTYSLIVNDCVFELFLAGDMHDRSDESMTISVNGLRVTPIVDNRRTLIRKSFMNSAKGAARSEVVRAPMPGKVVKIEVAEGSQVVPGTGIIVLEAMKMENEIKASIQGVVDKVYVEAGKAVEKGELLLSIKPSDVRTSEKSHAA
jgi:biotin carboxyl carrier protein